MSLWEHMLCRDSTSRFALRSPRKLLLNIGILIAASISVKNGIASSFAPLPAEVTSSHFTVAINGHRTPVLHAASGYYLLNFDVAGPAVLSITSDDPHFWDRGVEVQPMRFGIRPAHHGATISFPIPGPVKLSISRPGEHFAESEMLFLFGNVPARAPRADEPGLRYYGPGVHRENIEARSGDRIYLAPGAVVFGSLNLWQVQDVRVYGTGTIIYDGPQDPHTDEGWMTKPNWHCIAMKEARNIEIDGITCITRSRSWQVQMKDSRHIGLYNVKIVGGNPNNANQDGIDWLGGGDTTIANSFFRASDDVFAMYGNWDGYEPEILKRPGPDVTNIDISETVASTSISNTIRLGWPGKTFNSAHFHMHDMDVIHTGSGACKVPFAFFEMWADPDGHGSHSDYMFNNIRMEDWYSLFQIRQPAAQIRNIHFQDVWAMDGPAMLPPVLKGDVSEVQLRGVDLAGVDGAASGLEQGARPPEVSPAAVGAAYHYTAGILRPGQAVEFRVDAEQREGRSFEWIFGDGSRTNGRNVTHRFPDANGTLLDGSGRFRVILHVRDGGIEEAWSSQSIVLQTARGSQPKTADGMSAPVLYEGEFDIPADGGYTFTLLTSLPSSFSINNKAPVLSARPQAQVCGATGSAVQPLRTSAVLAKGSHTLRIIHAGLETENAEVPSGGKSETPVVLWEGPGVSRQLLPIKKQAFRAAK